MAATSSEWDAGAGVSEWIQPDERILWRGRPDPSVVFSPQDVVLVPVSIVWASFAIFWEGNVAHEGWTLGKVWGIPFVVLGIYIVVGRFIVKGWTRRHIWYAITTTRALEITKHGASLQQVRPSAFVEIRRRRDGQHGAAIFRIASQRQGDRSRLSTELLRGTAWPGYRRLGSAELAFVDVVGLRDLMSAARFAGFSISEAEPDTRFGLRKILISPIPAAAPTGGSLHKARHWVRIRLLKRPYALWSPLNPEELARRLAENLAPWRPFNFGVGVSFGVGGRGPTYRGSVSGWSVRLFSRSDRQANSWRTIFDGGIVVDGQGSWLTGTIGPSTFVPVFSVIWLGLVSLFFLGGLIGFISDVVTGKGISLLPLVLVPGAMIIFFFGLTEFGARSALREWQGMDEWLRSLLQVPDTQEP